MNEGFLKLFGGSRLHIRDEDHFFGVAARAMKQALIDYARSKKAGKRVRREMIPELLQPRRPGDPRSGLEARFALEKLERYDPVVARTIWLRCVEEMTIDETAAVQKLERWRVRQNYEFGLKWLAGRLTASSRL